MKITEISIRLGETVNLGDYSNFRPEIGMTAVVEPFDEADEVFAELADEMTRKLGVLVDNALELAGREPKYTADLYQVRYSDLRQSVVISAKGLALPQEKNWRDQDRWVSLGGIYGDLPSHMRIETAHKVATAAANDKHYGLMVASNPLSLTLLPPLPDPGPEPLWSKKELGHWLQRTGIPEDDWEMLAALPHVTPKHVRNIYSPFVSVSDLKDRIMAAPDAPSADEEE